MSPDVPNEVADPQSPSLKDEDAITLQMSPVMQSGFVAPPTSPVEDEDPPKTFQVWLIRHAHAHSKVHDPTLTERGVSEAKETKKELPIFNHIFISPMRRTTDTALILFDREDIAQTLTKKIVAIPDLQTIAGNREGRGMEAKEYRAMYSSRGIESSAISKGWNNKKQGRWACTDEDFNRRVMEFRNNLVFMRDNAKTDLIIGIVSHTSVFEKLLTGDVEDKFGQCFRSARWVRLDNDLCVVARSKGC